MSDINAIAKQFTGASGDVLTIDLPSCSSGGVEGGEWRVLSYWSDSESGEAARRRRYTSPGVCGTVPRAVYEIAEVLALSNELVLSHRFGVCVCWARGGPALVGNAACAELW
jgi:hypothetical protein